MSKPYLERTREGVARGHKRFAELMGKYLAVRDGIRRSERREEFQRLLEHSLATSMLLRDYVHTVLSYFEYRERRTAARRERLKSDLAALKASAESYRRSHRFYDVGGIDVTVKLASRMLEDPERAEAILRRAPTGEELAARLAAAREESLRLLAADPEGERVMRWQGTVDGRVILRIRGKELVVENLLGDGVVDPTAEFFQPVAARAGGRWLGRPVRARGVLHLMEEPSQANQGTASIYIDDPAPGNAVYEFELYWSGRSR